MNHRSNEIDLARLDPQWAEGRPRLLSGDDEDFVIQTATTCLTKLGQPLTRWSIRKLAAYPRRVHGRCLLLRRGITFQRTKTWKESPDPERDAKLDRIEHVLEHGCYSVGDDRLWGVNRRHKAPPSPWPR
ncbi:COG3415 family protein [Streptomyces sp. NPDC056683]|uniref:hypothetical protein n=1 Tax=Streptomyces sp. NPDC056683 TaxID=3345910 RepID=UPI00369E67F2